MASLWFLAMAFASVAQAEYTCICNYNVELDVRSAMNESAPPLGSLYEFDCKEILAATTVDAGWIAIAFEHHVGYVKTGQDVETQVCSGEAPDSDKVSATTTTGPETTTTSQRTNAPSTTTLPTTVTTAQPTTVTTTPPTTPTPVKTTASPATTTTAATTPSPTFTTATFAPSTTTHTITTRILTTKMPSSTTASPTTQSGIISGQTNLCPVALRSFASRDGGILAQYDKNCYELVEHTSTWSSAEKDCMSKGGHLVDINSQGEQEFIYNWLRANYNYNVWIGLHDLNKEGHFEWTSGEPVVYTNWVSGRAPHHSSQDNVYLNPHDGGHWDDDGDHGVFFPTHARHAYICQHEIDSNAMVHGTVDPHGDGNTKLCPSTVIHHAAGHHGILGHYGQNCYELLTRYDVTWSHGERLCQQEGGHLAHISSADEQSFVQKFMTNHSPDHGVWIGLNDRDQEGQLQWSSGTPVTYVNWLKGHTGNWDSSRREDCALFLPYANGHWDDLPCGVSTNGFFLGGSDFGESHPILCQFGTNHGTPVVG